MHSDAGDFIDGCRRIALEDLRVRLMLDRSMQTRLDLRSCFQSARRKPRRDFLTRFDTTDIISVNDKGTD